MKNITLKQLIRKMYMPRLIIPIILLVILIAVLIINPFHNHISPPKVKDLSTIDEKYHVEDSNISVTIPTLYYTGVDYTEDNKVKARIFYTLQDERCYFFIICMDNLKSDTVTLTDYSFNAHLTHNNNMYEAVIASMSEELNFSKDSLRKICSTTFVNQYDYTHSFETFVFYALYILLAMIIVDIIFIIIVFFNPHISIPFFRMRKYGKIGKLYRKAEREFNRDIISYENKIFLSDSFIFGITYADNVEAVILEHIVWIYKNKDYTARRNKEEITFTLCIVTDQKQLIKIMRVPEDTCDLVIRKVQKMYPHIMAEEN